MCISTASGNLLGIPYHVGAGMSRDAKRLLIEREIFERGDRAGIESRLH